MRIPTSRREPVTGPDQVASRPDRRTAALAIAAPAVAALAIAPALRWLVVAESVPYGQPRRSGCDSCGTPIGPTGPIRTLSPRARCANCGTRIGAPPLTVELVLLLAVTVLVVANRPLPESIAFAWWAGCAVPLFFVDVAVHRLPDRLTFAAAGGTLALLGVAALVAGDPSAWWRAVLAGLGAGLSFGVSTLLLGQRGFGLGDAKLAVSSVALLGWLGWPAVVLGLLLAFTGSALCALVLLATRRIGWRGHLPFGPFLILGTLAALPLPPAG